jgi:hypothetical protein
MWLKWIAGLVLIAHGIGHAMGFMASWTTIPSGLTTGHWLFSGDVTMNSALGRAFGLLWLVGLVAFVGAGFGLLMGATWWQPLAIAASVISLVAIVPWLGVMPVGSAIGAVAVDVITLVALLTPWGESLTRALR